MLIAASIVAVLVASIHSVLGEWFMFRVLRDRGVVPNRAAPPLRGRHVRILWATWHLASVFGLGFAALLFAIGIGQVAANRIVLDILVGAFAISALLVLFASRGRHPGWVGLLTVAALIVLAQPTAVAPG